MGKLIMNKNKILWNKALLKIPSGNSFLSKNPSRYKSKDWPEYFSKSKGSIVWDLNGKKYYDFAFMGVGTNILGYTNYRVDNAVIKKIKEGNMSTLNCPEEVMFAEKLLKLHPWAKMAKFAKTGAEANAIAIRLSRAFNKKNKIIVCGYHGWHDWYLSAKYSKDNYLDTHLFPSLKTEGVPTFLKKQIYSTKYNDFESLKKITKKDSDISCIIMEVERDQKPNEGYLKSIRSLCNRNNICLIFDECTTGFRDVNGGIHLKYGVNPDLAMFGKAIGNGYSIASIIGKKSIMMKSNKSFISSTFWSERIGYVAGIATLNEMSRIKSWNIISQKGRKIKELLSLAAHKNKIGIKFKGLDALIKFDLTNSKIKDYEAFITKEMLKKGFLATNSIYVSISHSDSLIKKYVKEMDAIFKKLSKN
jgi:glutamate-1-semialdehyde 2,1-aminomutase